MKTQWILLRSFSEFVNNRVGQELRNRGIPDEECLARTETSVTRSIPRDILHVLRSVPKELAEEGKDYVVVDSLGRVISPRVRLGLQNLERVIQKGRVLSRGVPPKKPTHIVS